ncbi:MAG: thiol reductant ABC exporter subunit CydD [Brevundimonas sp.]|uniref:thiol reductant ABC exporter subunit CydD n=1 Tax=Brevundimonas sp. TaxID=1871086 RepID=UPI00271765D4|nr:thiol reductant ABC exporter subunit CydD [Brevundimonas sp.]MDO9587299.1 thiol reductant ABC exporter subunit CydD [Brevundimonas sp.]
MSKRDMTAEALNSPDKPALWLREAGRPWARLNGLAAAVTVLDIVPAAGFAGGLAMAVSVAAASPASALPWLALAMASLAVRGLLALGAAAAGARAARAVKGQVRRGVAVDLFEGRRPGSAPMAAIAEGVDAIDGYYARFAPARLAATVSPLVAIAIIAVASPVAAAILLFTLIPFTAGMALAGVAAAGESRKQFAAMARLSGLFLDRIRGLPVVLAFQAEDAVTRDVARSSTDLALRTSRVLRIAFLSTGVLEFFSALSVALVAVYCGFNLLRLLPFPVPEQLDLGRALFVLALSPEVYAPIRRLAAAYHDRQAAEAAAPSLVAAPVTRTCSPARLGLAAPAVRFEHATISYGGGAPVVSAFDLDVRPGQIVALAGSSGSGKSSLLHLLLGLAPLDSGDVVVGGERLSAGGDFSGRIAWASQAPMIVPGTLRDNIALADRSASVQRITEAACRAGLSADLQRPLDERGGGLSGGELRRLALARAILKDAPLLLLDEPTANLDAGAERAMLSLIREAARGRTTLIATHSPAVMAIADRVVTL